MKKTVVIFTINLLVCVTMFLFNIAKFHSMEYEMKDISGDANVLNDVTISTMLGDFDSYHFNILVNNGVLSYQYEPYFESAKSNVYLSTDIMMNVDTSDIEFKEIGNEVEEHSYPYPNDTSVSTKVYGGTLERAHLDVSAVGSIKDTEHKDTYIIAKQDIHSGLQIVSTLDNPLRYEKYVHQGEALSSAYPQLIWENRSQDSLCFKKGERNYVGMPNINAQLEGSAHIYDITLTDSYPSSFLDSKYRSLLEIPISLGTNGFLYVYKDQYIVVLQRENIAQISKYDANMTLLEQLEIPLLNPQSTFTYYGEREMLVLQADNTFTAFDIHDMEVKDEVTIPDTYVVQDSVYRKNRFYFSALIWNNNNRMVDPFNTNILVYEHEENLYIGEVYLMDENQVLINSTGIMEFRQDKTLFLRDES